MEEEKSVLKSEANAPVQVRKSSENELEDEIEVELR